MKKSKIKIKLSWITKLSLFLLMISIILLLKLCIEFSIYANKAEDISGDAIVFGVMFYIFPIIYYLFLFLFNRKDDVKGKQTNKLIKIILLLLPLVLNISSILSEELEWSSNSKHTQTLKDVSLTFPSDFEVWSSSKSTYSKGITFDDDNGCKIGFELVKYEKDKDFLTQFKERFGNHFNVYDQDQIYLLDIDIQGEKWKYYYRMDRNDAMYAYVKGNYFYNITMSTYNDPKICNEKLNEVFNSIKYK